MREVLDERLKMLLRQYFSRRHLSDLQSPTFALRWSRIYDRIGSRSGDQGLPAPHVALQEARHRMLLSEVGKDAGDGPLLRTRRGEGDGRKEFFSKRLPVADGERSERIVFFSLACARYLYGEYFFKREAFAGRFAVPQVVGFVDIQKRASNVGQVVALYDIGGNRVVHRIQDVRGVEFVECMPEPKRRHAAAFGIHSEIGFRFQG